MMRNYRRRFNSAQLGFTLIELAIVLVVIGLVAGGILTGRNLIGAAGERAQIRQIEQYNAAVNTFRAKYGYLPGDIPATPAAQFGFVSSLAPGNANPWARFPSSSGGDWNGNGIIEGNNSLPFDNPGDSSGTVQAGETLYFWLDIGMSGLIGDGAFYAIGSPNNMHSSCDGATNANGLVGTCLPEAKIAGGNYIYVWSNNGVNYYGLSAVNNTNAYGHYMTSAPGLTVKQAAAIDAKMDDGLPQTGAVIARYVNASSTWAGTADMAATPAGPSSC